MRCTIIAALLAAGMLFPAARSVGQEAPASTLTSIRYSARGDASRLVLSFAGDVRYATERRGDSITVRFSSAGLASPPGTSELGFKEGWIRSARAERKDGNVVAVRIVVRDHAQATVKLAAVGGKVVVEANPPAKSGPVDLSAVTGMPPIPAAKPVTGALARASHQAPAPPSVLSPAALLTILILVSALTTAAVLAVIARHGLLAARTASAQAGNALGSFDAPADLEEEESRRWETQVERRDEDIDDYNLTLARTFRRTKEEIDLANRLRGEGRPAAGRPDVKALESLPKAGAQRVRAAKELKVGLGEVDLAIRLKNLKNNRNDNQEEAHG